ncbi:MAG: hypothetical protein K6E14_11275 [Paludibacteraceae bacterium]|jgi:hypothetical protein|nr:hypothetical protein [Paludibacteraceae bacterium]
MATITLQYDARNSVAKKFIEFITSIGIFSVVNADKPNSDTLQARKDTEEGKFAHTFKSEKEFTKFMNEL